MPNLTSVGITAGVPTSGTGTVSTIDNLLATSLPLPTGASTSAKQPALGTAGSASTDVVTVQGIASGTAQAVNGNLANNIDGVTVTTTGNVGSDAYSYVFNGTTWDRAQGLVSGTAGTPSTQVLSIQGVPSGTTLLVNRTSDYPAGATPITASATGTTAATTATFAAAPGKVNYLCGFMILANATAAATGNATVTGTVTGTLNFTQWTAAAASGIGVINPHISIPIQGSGVNVAMSVVSAAPGTGGVVSVSMWGYQL